MTWPEGYGRRILAEVDSTMAEAARLAPSLAGPEWIMARGQTAARGRRGRHWVMPEGNLAATLVMRVSEPPAIVALRSFVASLALFDAVAAVTGQAGGLALKWPNDVLLNGGKLAGILLESSGANLAIGIGVNLAFAPGAEEVEPGAVRPVSLMSETGVRVTPEEFLEYLAAAYAGREAQFTTFGFGPIRTAWLDRAARLGQPVVARTGRAETRGTFETVDDTGQLVLKTPKGRVRIPAADVYL
ncbi:biotin--[acetyl-CoA-carboxylase] ligase [Aestuariicoccus sp. MJ-SS9]|uniref:biotin--[acetyl-CoA-carboxylase] ligase n=1 Tax=Aestuariicoccus sp. MJ-SS9 TaxID=3079855 RepID=UPI002911DB4A|nr:biotin--[acetyl-CoA-carboxylase] ligase [Aestuariicoccus sp. MJ-SS9]MDU8910568.1 biotin--[acetyl-CoA-carboxylase] ligase [Aestuariicoccus sp. MJ-SS9]